MAVARHLRDGLDLLSDLAHHGLNDLLVRNFGERTPIHDRTSISKDRADVGYHSDLAHAV